MKITTLTLPCLVALLAIWQNPKLQEKKKPVLPPLENTKQRDDASKRPPDLEQQKGDLVQRFPKKNPLVGVWRVQQRGIIPGQGTGQTSGYIVITKTHFSRHLIRKAPFKKLEFQNMFGTYSIQGNSIIITTLMGMTSSHKPGELFVIQPGSRERRRFQLLGKTLLRIHRSATRSLDFMKIADL